MLTLNNRIPRMSVLVNLRKHYKSKDAESGSSFDPLTIPFIPRALSLKLENAQEFSLPVSPAEKKSTYKYKAITFSNRSPEDVLEWEKKLSKVIKNKPVDAVDGHFDLVEALLKGDTLTHWQEFKRVETSCTSKIWTVRIQIRRACAMIHSRCASKN
eukprot:1663538-Ditylum_brightwellii.AAC.1